MRLTTASFVDETNRCILFRYCRSLYRLHRRIGYLICIYQDLQ